MCSGTIAVMVLALALLAFSTTTVSSFVISSRTSTEHSFVAATNACRRCRRSSDTRTATRSSSRGSRQRQELTCGLQITVRIRGKKSREEDYTNQVRCNMLMGRLLRPRARSSCMDSATVADARVAQKRNPRFERTRYSCCDCILHSHVWVYGFAGSGSSPLVALGVPSFQYATTWLHIRVDWLARKRYLKTPLTSTLWIWEVEAAKMPTCIGQFVFFTFRHIETTHAMALAMRQAYDEYVKRLRPVLALDTQWHKTDEELEAAVRKDSGAVVRYTCGHTQSTAVYGIIRSNLASNHKVTHCRRTNVVLL